MVGIPIGELSRLTGVNIEAIRYYEKIKMLRTPPRTEGGRRIYGPTETRVLAFIRRARELGGSVSMTSAPCSLWEHRQRPHAQMFARSPRTILTIFAPRSPISESSNGCSQRLSRNVPATRCQTVLS
jgi:DNA-binding transcriptional MerR regulator